MKNSWQRLMFMLSLLSAFQEFKALTALCTIFTFGIFNWHPQINDSVL